MGKDCSAGCVKQKGKCVPAAAAPATPVAKADMLMRKRTIDSCLKAADIYEANAAQSTGADAAALQLQAADALNCAMRIKTTGNILLLEGTLDTPPNKKFWAQHGPRALGLVRAAKAAHAPYKSDASAAAIEMDSFMYQASSKGMLRQALTGAGVTFLKLADDLVSNHHSFDGHVGHCYLGGFYTAAPWPLQDRKRGLKEMEAAYQASPKVRRNGYYACLLRYMHDDYEGAVSACQYALDKGRCDGPTQPDYCSFLTSETKRMLNLAVFKGFSAQRKRKW